MNNLRQVGLGILAALVSVAILLGSLSLALLESATRQALSPYITWTPLATLPTPSTSPFASSTFVTPVPGSPILTGAPTATLLPSPIVIGSPTVTGSPILTATPSPTSSPTATLTPSPTAHCRPPSDWSPITIQDGDTLKSLANEYRTTAKVLARVNCMVSNELIPGVRLYVPGLPPPRMTIPCGPPFGWAYYTVQPGDTLYHIAQFYDITVQQLMVANCLDDSNIRAGQSLFVPYVHKPNPTSKTRPRKTPKPPTPTPLPSSITPTYTLPAPITGTPAPTKIPTDTPVPTKIPTDTPMPTKIPTDTPVPTELPTNTLIPPTTVVPTPS